MGCVSSKFATKDLNQEILLCNGDVNHIVSLTSSTYGVLKLDPDPPKGSKRSANGSLKSSPQSLKRSVEEPEIINAWELMGDLDDDETPNFSPAKKFPKSPVFLRTVTEIGFRDSSKISNRTKSPLKQRNYAGKENNKLQNVDWGRPNSKQVLKPSNSVEKPSRTTPKTLFGIKNPHPDLKIESFRRSGGFSTSNRSYSPLFDPELLASLERELSEERKQRKIAKHGNYKNPNSDLLLKLFEKKCPPGGENSVILYTTTLRGIRKTFEDCNAVRSAIEAHQIRMVERDISMDSGFRDELRILMGSRNVRVPVVFVKGRLIGGAEEVWKMEEEGNLGLLFEGLPAAAAGPGCEGCAGVRFVMCMDCNGSCKVLDEQRKVARCGECNENGLIKCPICC